MKTTLARTLGVVATGALALSLVAAHEGVETNDFVMNGAQETQPGDMGAQARAHVSIPEDDGTAICLDLEITKPLAEGSTITGLHIHEAGRNEAGPVTVDLGDLIDDLAEDGAVDGCIDDPTDLADNPVSGPTLADIVLQGRDRFTDEYYLNLHTDEFGAGAIRGQIKGENYRPVEGPRGNARGRR